MLMVNSHTDVLATLGFLWPIMVFFEAVKTVALNKIVDPRLTATRDLCLIAKVWSVVTIISCKRDLF